MSDVSVAPGFLGFTVRLISQGDRGMPGLPGLDGERVSSGERPLTAPLTRIEASDCLCFFFRATKAPKGTWECQERRERRERRVFPACL